MVEADRRSNDRIQLEVQKQIFDKFGYFYERKKGEFFDGSHNQYIDRSQIIDREEFLRTCFAIAGKPDTARGSSAKVLFRKSNFDSVLNDAKNYVRMFFAYRCLVYLEALQKRYNQDPNNKFGVVNFGNALRFGKYAVVYVADALSEGEVTADGVEQLVQETVDSILSKWLEFEEDAKGSPLNRNYFQVITDPNTGQESFETNFDRYYKVANVKRDLKKFFSIT